ncbi:hypothetical protein [Flavobacterium sedimenticola]|uniref:Uncharacterized protein n=1 Tax=Flavobacterium sedimenticola TaxID=3043286 RepID=A0ABT6XML9_9FLAO|nr:hypothetical protein [Flavobacterium sedimenticola]MDI9256332.1 hypothetical protein [Flavobacterium sedimenticola]
MGKFKNSVEKLLLSKPRMFEFERFSEEQKEFVEHVVKNYVKPNPILRKYRFLRSKDLKPKQENFWNFSWQDILMIRKSFKDENLFETFRIVYGITEKEFMLMEIFNVFAALKFITDQLEMLRNAEEERLHSELTPEEIEAGAEELQEYDYYNSLKAMEPDLLKHDELLKLPYSIIFRDMAHSKVLNDVKKNHNDIIARKNKKPR